MNWTFWVAAGALLNALGVALGAFGAHFFKSRLGFEDLAIYETAVRYLFIHALALVALGLIAERMENMALKVAGFLFLMGIVLFSGSLFALIATKIRLLGAITPLGGLCFMAGWLALAAAVAKIFTK